MNEERLTALFHQAADTAEGRADQVIAASVQQGRRLIRIRRRRRLVAVAGIAAVVGAGLTYAVSLPHDGTDRAPDSAASAGPTPTSTPVTFGVDPERMAQTLASMVRPSPGTPNQITQLSNGTLPPWFGEGPLGGHDLWSASMRSGSLAMRIGNVTTAGTDATVIAVAVDHVSYAPQHVALMTLCRQRPARYSCVAMSDGMMLLADRETADGRVHRLAVRIVTSGWIIEAQSLGHGQPSVSLVASNQQWLQ